MVASPTDIAVSVGHTAGVRFSSHISGRGSVSERASAKTGVACKLPCTHTPVLHALLEFSAEKHKGWSNAKSADKAIASLADAGVRVDRGEEHLKPQRQSAYKATSARAKSGSLSCPRNKPHHSFISWKRGERASATGKDILFRAACTSPFRSFFPRPIR